MSKPVPKPSLLHLSVEEENLAAIPFAVLERRVGKRIGKLEIQGTKVLPDGAEVHVSWQVQGNTELGLPTEQDLDIFVALGSLTFQNNFAKTVTFSGREIAKILGIHSVHGKFYQRLKMAMDRFIALRFRGIAASERQEGANRRSRALGQVHDTMSTCFTTDGERPAFLVTDAVGYRPGETHRTASPGDRGWSSCARGPNQGG